MHRIHKGYIYQQENTPLYDNTKAHNTRIIQQQIWKVVWTFLAQPPYSPEITATDYHFQLFENHLKNTSEIFSNEDKIQ